MFGLCSTFENVAQRMNRSDFVFRPAIALRLIICRHSLRDVCGNKYVKINKVTKWKPCQPISRLMTMTVCRWTWDSFVGKIVAEQRNNFRIMQRHWTLSALHRVRNQENWTESREAVWQEAWINRDAYEIQYSRFQKWKRNFSLRKNSLLSSWRLIASVFNLFSLFYLQKTTTDKNEIITKACRASASVLGMKLNSPYASK